VNYDIFVRYLELLQARGHLAEGKEGISLSDAGRRLRAELVAWLARLFAP